MRLMKASARCCEVDTGIRSLAHRWSGLHLSHWLVRRRCRRRRRRRCRWWGGETGR